MVVVVRRLNVGWLGPGFVHGRGLDRALFTTFIHGLEFRYMKQFCLLFYESIPWRFEPSEAPGNIWPEPLSQFTPKDFEK